MDQHGHHNDTRTREREVIVTDSGRSSGIGGVVAAVVGAIVVLLLAWMLFFNGAGGDEGGIEAPVPDDVTVNLDDGAEGAGGEG